MVTKFSKIRRFWNRTFTPYPIFLSEPGSIIYDYTVLFFKYLLINSVIGKETYRYHTLRVIWKMTFLWIGFMVCSLLSLIICLQTEECEVNKSNIFSVCLRVCVSLVVYSLLNKISLKEFSSIRDNECT